METNVCGRYEKGRLKKKSRIKEMVGTYQEGE